MQEAQTRKKRKKRMRLPNGLGSVHKIGDGKSRRNPWRARVPSHVELDEVKGTAKQKYITLGYYATEVEAIEALMEYRKNPYTLEAASCTFDDIYELWKAKKFQEISKASQRSYNAAYKNSASLHKMKMREIRASHMEAIIQSTTSGYVVQSKLIVFWGQLFKYAMEHDIVQKNYAEFVKTRDSMPETSRTAVPLEDREKIWKEIEAGNHDAELVMIYLFTGMRASELLEVRKENVDLEARIMVGGLKTEAGKNRRIPIHKCILPFIERLMQTEGELLVMRYDKGAPTPMSYGRFMQYNWKPVMEKLGLTEYTPHYGRHTMATMLREAKIPEDLRKLILGHARGDITDRYTHHPDEMLLEAVDSLPWR